MIRKSKKALAALCSLTLTAGLLPVMPAAAAESGRAEPSLGGTVYHEDFEDGNIKDVVLNGQRGFSIVGSQSESASDRFALDVGNGFGTGSGAIRFANIAWGGNNSLTLDLSESAKEKGYDGFEAASEGNIALSVKMMMDADFGGFWNGGTNTLIIENKNGEGMLGLEAYTKDNGKDDITLNLIALNDDGTENIRYELARGKNNVFKVTKDLMIYFDAEGCKYQIRINNEAVSAGSYGEWIPISTSGVPGKAAKAKSFSLGRVKIDNQNSNWYGGIVLDDIAASYWTSLEFNGDAPAPDKAMTMWYRMPAAEWAQSVPLGNGRIGANVWGGIINDTLSLSEVTAWSGEDHTGKALNKDGSTDNYAALNNLRQEMSKANPDRNRVSQYLTAMEGKGNSAFGTNRPFGKLSFTFAATGKPIENYRRSLDLENAVSTVEYKSDGVNYTRTAYVSNPAQVAVMKYEADKNGKITFDAGFETEQTNGGSGAMSAPDGEYLRWDGAVYNNSDVKNGVKTFAFLKALNDGGSVSYDSDGIHVDGADSVTLILSLGTDFKAGADFKQNSAENALSELNAAVQRADELYAEHTADVSALFNRMKVEIGAASELKSDKPTDERLEEIREGGEISGSFMSLWYQYARYLMIAGSRENSPMPMNLLGIWNDNVAANMSWTCDYHIDMNTQMNQWMANSANLSEAEKPIFKWMKDILIPSGQSAAKDIYGIDNGGWFGPISTNAWGWTGLSEGAWEAFTDTTCGAWLAQEVMSYYDHTGDKEFLSGDGWYILDTAARFYNDFLYSYTDKNGTQQWVAIPSGSPENGNLEVMTTMDMTVIMDIFEQLERCYDILGKEKDDFYNQIDEKLKNIQGQFYNTDLMIKESGNLAEWPYRPGTDDGNTNHRHTSHLLGLFPYAQITPDKTPELARAALISMRRRFDRADYENTEWTAINAAGQYARLKNGEKAYDYLKLEANTFTWPNLLSFSPGGIALASSDVYCIDGTFGTGAAMAEMLLQSHSNRLEFLPALPKEWDEGKIEGMSAAGAFDVDFTWKDYTIESASIHSKSGNTVNILKNASINWNNAAVYDEDGNIVDTGASTAKLLTFNTEAGKTYTIKNLYGGKLQTGHIVNDTDPGIKYSGFNYHDARELPDIGNDIHYSERAGSTIEYTFTGTGIDVISEGNGGSKLMNVYIDNSNKGAFSAKSDTNVGQKVLYSIDGLDFGTHTIKLEQAEDGGYFEFDAFAVRGRYFEYINDDDPRVTYSGDGWGRGEGRGAERFDYMGDIHYYLSDQKGGSVSVEFTGTGIDTIFEKNGGSAELSVDGVSYGEVDIGSMPASSDRCHNIMSIDGLPNGEHTLTVTHTNGWSIVDSFVVYKDKSGMGLNPGTYEISGLSGGGVLCAARGELSLTSEMTGADNQKWYMDYVDNRVFRLINAQSGMAAAISTGDNRSIVQQPVDETDRYQLWQKLPYTIDNGEFQIMSCAYPQFMQIDGAYSENGGGVALWSYENSDHTRWTAEDAGDGFILIRNLVGTYLEADPSNITSAGAWVKTWEKLSGNDQLWEIKSAGGDYYTISNDAAGLSIVSDNGRTAVSADNGGDNALWTAESKKSNGTAYYTFTNAADKTTLTFSGESGWKLSPKSAAQASPAAENISVSGAVNAGGTLNVTYDYMSSVNAPEGDSVYNVYIMDSVFSKAENPIATGSAAGGFEVAVPSDYTRSSVIAIEINPKTADGYGNGRFFKYITPPSTDNTSMQADVKASKIFEQSDVSDIASQSGGWSLAGGNPGIDYTLSVGEKDGVSNVLSIAPTEWWKDGRILFNLDDAGIGKIEGNGYVEFDAMFDAPNYFDRESRMIFALNNGTTDFAAIRLMGRRLEATALTDDGAFRQIYTIAQGMDELYGKWINFKLYTNGSDSFAVAVNDEFLRNNSGGIWFKASQNAVNHPGNAASASAGTIAAVKMGIEWAGKDSSFRLANMRFGTYSKSAVNDWIITSMEPEGGRLEFGKTNDINVTVVKNGAAENGALITGLYKDGVLVTAKITDGLTFDSQGVSRASVGIDVPEQGGSYEIKGFVWNSAEGMTPIGGAFSKKINVESEFKLPNVFSDNMMLQADEPVTVWGAALDGRDVSAVLKNNDTGEEFTGDTVSNGEFGIELPAQEAGGNYTLSVSCGSETRTYKNIIFGDVYLLAGQSNMEYWMSGLADTAEDLRSNPDAAENPDIRTVDLLSKGTDGVSSPQENLPEVSGTMWKPMTYSNAQSASQIGYYFAQQLNAETGRPIGFIGAAVGGTGSDRWVKNGSLYNNRVYPIRNLKLSGVLYYQGEADEGKSAEQYSDIMAGIIDDYRELFNDSELPFWYAQLARYSNQNFEKIRAGQFLALEKVSNPENVGIVSNLDEVGNFGSVGNTSGNARHDIHPYGKKEVARRFALYAKRDVYGEETAVSGPVFKSMETDADKAVLTFECSGGLKIMNVEQYGDYRTDELILSGDLNPDILNGFEIAGEDGVYYAADAEISGDTVTLTSGNVKEPVSVRYAWGAYPESPNLTDDTNLPSYTFEAFAR